MPAAATWKTRDGRRIAIDKLDDDHLASILLMGLRAVHRQAVRDTLEALGAAYGGDEGCQYLGDVQYEDDIRKARSIPHLRSRLAKSTRYAPLLAEAARRGLRWTHRKATRAH
jgi:hypothetical protein